MKTFLGAVLLLIIFSSLQAQLIGQSCGRDDFRCDSGKCIPKNQRCNKVSDCPGNNGEDEKNCDCTKDEFQCLDDLSCIEIRKQCDNTRHCNDGSDEKDCPPGCPQDQFKCPFGSLLPCARKCDGVPECDNHEDEDDCPGDITDECDHECDGQCLDRNKICDGTEDCNDGSDEYLCNKCDGPNDFRCANEECINLALRCNTLPDCTDSSDELGCNATMISTHECTDEEFLCKNNHCINQFFVCDGRDDCNDNSDEENCGCQEYEWQCRSGRCIQLRLRCDGADDCPDNSDELDCPEEYPTPTPWRPIPMYTTTPRPVYTAPPRPRPADRDDSRGCPRNQWRCENGPCIDLALRCDGTLNCPLDDSDELDCPPNSPPALQLKTYPDAQTVRNDGDVVFQCRDEGPMRAPVRWIREGGRPLKPGYSDRNGRLELSQVTTADNGVYICQAPRFLGTPGAELRVTLNVLPPVHTDRSSFSTCRPHEATCGSGQCIPKSAVCDGKFDCRDRSDEETCYESGMCEPNQFRCDNRRCVLKSWICDSDDDCGDGSDEQNCGISVPGQHCLPTEFTCARKQCIPKSFRCDGHSDCMDRSDEIGCIEAYVSKAPYPPYVQLNPGQTLNLECDGVGVPPPLITWRLNWGHVPQKCISKSENGTGTLTCPDMQPDDSGAYSCEVLSARVTAFARPDAIVYVNRTNVCPNGYFNREARLPSDCIRCFCFGESTQCKSAELFIYNMPTPLGQGGTRLVGVKQTYNSEVQIDSQPITDHYYYNSLRNGATITKVENYGYPVSSSSSSYPYLTLPESYNGNQLTSYGGYIRYKVSPQSPRPSSAYDNMPDIIIKGKFETIVYKSQSRSSYPRETYVEARLTQGNWQKSKPNGLVPATREDIMMALDNVELILLRASVNDVGVNITDFVMVSAQDFDAELGTANLVEECTCPPGYGGLSCQKCAAGYVRQKSGPWLGTCVRAAPAPCPPGTYGDPGSGFACQPCPCPLTNRENQFARTCSLGPRGNVICDCAPGYEGEQCQYCSPDYTGNPLVPGDSCQRKPSSNCNPAGTLQVRLPDECECKEHVQGRYCDQCKGDTFHLSEENRHGCALCFCTGVTGQCTSSNLRRKTTTVTYNIPQIVDQVNVYESALFTGAGSERYDAPVATAARPQLVRGELTLNAVERSRNIVYYWSLPRSFAGDIVTSYGGYLRYVLRNVPVSGFKNNAPNIQLISENRLTFHYFGKFEPSSDGTLNASVQFLEAGWQRADGKEISRQHFLLALADVKAILVKATYTSNSELATLVSSSIDTADQYGDGPPAVHVEQCVCPAGYLGTSCEDCAPGYTRSSSGLYLESCEPCSCGGHSDTCDPETGVCTDCQDNTAGYNCEECKPGYKRDAYQQCVPSRPFPSSCNCDSRGEAEPCDDQGNCRCKPNVEGQSCDRCRIGTFGLDQDNPDGCTPCYCSGVTRDCVETPKYSRIAIPAPIIGENYGNYSITDLTASQIINDHFVPSTSESELTYIFPFLPNEELFWSIPQFTGNRLLSYGGNLALTQRFESGPYPSESTPGTDVVLFGDEGAAVYWPNNQAIRSGESLSYRVPLIERGWFLFNSRTPASRSDFMTVLKNLKRVLIRATLTPNILSTSIADVSMDTAGETFGASSAKGIESCSCPPGYTGRSCESCTAGFYQNRGRCQQCNCNGHNCHLTSYGDVVCDCRAHYSGVDCSIIEGDPQVLQTTTNRPPPPQSTVTVTISSPTIRIENVGGQVNFTCEARSRMVQGALPVNWTKVDGHLPQGRTYIDQSTGVLFISQVQVSDSGRYICQTSDGISTGQAIASLTVGSNPMTKPTVSIRPSVNEYYAGDRIELECVTSGNPTPNIVWQRASGQPLPLAVDNYKSYLIIPNAREEDSGEYRCIATNTAGSKDSIAAIFVRPRPSQPTRDRLTISPSTPNVVEGQSTKVICTGTASIPVGSIGWTRQDGAELAQNVRSETGVLYIDVARLDNQGVYVCQTTSEQAASVPILVTVVPLSTPPPSEVSSISVSVDSLKIPTGGSGTIECNPRGYPPPSIKWSKHNNNFGPGTSQRGNTLIISNAQEEDGGYYMCTGSVDGTVVANTYVMVEIETRIPPKVEIWPQGELAVTLGGQFELHCRVLAGVPPPDIEWSRSRDRTLTPSTHLQPHAVLKFDRVEVNDEGEYVCTATNLAGKAIAYSTLRVRSVPEITLTPDSFIEANPGDPVEVHCRANGYPEPMVSIKLRSDDRELVPASPGIASLRVGAASERDDGDYVCTAVSAAGTVAEQFTIRVERGDIGFGGEGSGENDFDTYPNPDQDQHSEQDQNPDQDQLRPKPLVAIEGQDTTLGCDISNNLYTVKWDRVGEQLQRYAQQIGNELIIRNATKRDSGQYECVLIDRRTGITYKSAYTELLVMAQPRITLRPPTQTVRPGQSPTVECIVEGDDIQEISWRPVQRPLSRRVQTRDSTLIFRQIEVEDAGRYECFTKNRVANASAVAQVIVSGPREVGPALVTIEQPRRQFVVGENVKVICRAAFRGVRATWERYRTRQHVEQRPYGDGSVLILNSVAESDAGVYRCIGTDSTSSSFDDFNLEIQPGSSGPSYPVNRRDETYTARVGELVIIPCRHNLEQPVSYEWRSEFSSLPPDVRSSEENLNLQQVSEADAGTYICTVSNGRTRDESRVVLLVTGVVPKFNGNSWLTMKRLEDAYLNFDIEISFKPIDSNGLILYNSQNEGRGGDSIALQLVDSVPQMVLELTGSTLVVKGDRPLRLNTWHTVRMSRMYAIVTMNVDDAGPFTAELPNKLQAMELKQPLYIGGVPDYSQLPNVLSRPSGFIGCVGMLILGKQEKDIMMDSIKKYQVGECDSCSPNPCLHDGICQEARNERGYVCLCPANYAGQNCDHPGEGCRPRICGPGKCTETADSYKCSCPITFTGPRCNIQQSIEYPAFTGSAYLAIKTPETERSLHMSMKIKAMSPVTDGIIMYCAESDLGHGGFTALIVREGRLEFRYQLGDGSSPVILTSQYPLPANEWTEVNISRTVSVVLLRVNQNYDIQEGRLDSHKALRLTTALYVGGVDDTNIVLNNNTGVTGGFSGCIKDVTVQAGPVNIVTASIESNNVTECTHYERGDIPEERPGLSPQLTRAPLPAYRTPGYSDPCREQPCRNRGTCRPNSSSRFNYTCDCPLGFAGTHCHMKLEFHTEVGFDGNGYLELAAENLHYNENPVVIAITINSRSDNGVVLYHRESAAHPSSGDFILLRVENGHVVFEWDQGDGASRLAVENVDVSDGLRHNIIVKMNINRREVELTVDQTTQTETYVSLASVMHADSNIYLGGIPERLNVNGHPGLTGCIVSVEFTDMARSLDLGAAAVAGRNVQRCKEQRRF